MRYDSLLANISNSLFRPRALHSCSIMSPTSVVSDALVLIAGDAYRRSTRIFSSLGYNLWFGLALVPSVSGQSDDSGYTELNSTEPNYNSFVAGPVDNATSDGQKILADVDNFMSKSLEWSEWVARADQIRASGSFEYCIGNLSLALSGVGAAYQVGSSGASTLLTLLPTAGALIGAPAKELWVLYKLVPVAGVLSMMLSLGGNIVPMEVNEYERIDSFSYQGMMGSHSDERPTVPSDIGQQGLSQAEIFANEVRRPSRGFAEELLRAACLSVDRINATQLKPPMAFAVA